MAHEWFVMHGGKPHGPFSSANLKKLADDGKITPTTSVRRGNDSAWVPASRVQGLFSAAASPPNPAKPAAQTATQATVTQAAPAPRGPQPPAAPPVAPPAPPKADPLVRASLAGAPLPKATPVAKAVKPSSGGAMAGKVLGGVALIVGILALATCWLAILGGLMGWTGLVTGSLGLLLGIFALVVAAMAKGSGLGLSIAGTSTSLVALVLSIVLGIQFGLFSGAKPPVIIARAPPPVTTPPPKEEPPPKEPEPEPEPQWFDASEAIEQGSIRAKIESVGIEQVRIESMDLSTLKAAKPKPMLMVRVSVENIAQDKVVEFAGWLGGAELVGQGVNQLLGSGELGKALQSATAGAVLKDNLGYPYKLIPQIQLMGGGLKLDGGVVPLRPGESSKAELVFPVPDSKIEYLRLELSPNAYGGSEPLRFQIPKAMVKGL
jgi:hypothetical protein